MNTGKPLARQALPNPTFQQSYIQSKQETIAKIGRKHAYGLDHGKTYLYWVHFSEKLCHDIECEHPHCKCMNCQQRIESGWRNP